MDEQGWQRRCALCGTLDTDLPQPVPSDGDWSCRRCSAVRALWEPVAVPERRRRPA